MAKSGELRTAAYNNDRYLIFRWSEKSQSIEDNQTVIEWELKGAGGSTTNYYMAGNFKLVINGTTVYSSATRIKLYRGTLLSSGTTTIKHNSNGKKNFTVSAQAAIYYTSVNSTGSDSWDLTDIPRKATLLTAPNFKDGENPTIAYSNPAGNSVDKLEACIKSADGNVVYVDYKEVSKTGSSYTFDLSSEWATLRMLASDSNTLQVSFWLRTKINDTNYFSHIEPKTYSIENANPIVNGVINVDDKTKELTGSANKLIKYYSSAQATMAASGQKGAVMNEDLYIIRNGDKTGYGTQHTFNNVETNEFIFSAEDSRGNIGTDTVKLDMVNYIKLTCNISNNRPDGNGDMQVLCSGNCFNGSFGAKSNTLTVQYSYKEYGGSFSEWADMTVTKNGNSYYATAYLSGLDYQKTYIFVTRATDSLDTVTSRESKVNTIPLFHWGENDFVFNVPVTFNAGIVGAETDNGIWTPSCNVIDLTYTAQYGWYSKMGQTVTVGFYIKATCPSGYSGLNITIWGLPFTPMYSAAGGGMCSGAYISGGFNFQCFVAETSGNITTRVQACNNTAATNISTSATGCNYRNGGGELTLSGTITFMANS